MYALPVRFCSINIRIVGKDGYKITKNVRIDKCFTHKFNTDDARIS